MKKLLAAVTVLAVSTAQADDIIADVIVYYIDEFIQFNGTNTFIDQFSDGEEPPAGPLSASDYIVGSSFGIDRENGETELLELNSSDDGDDGELVCAVESRSFFFSAGSGGSLTGVFKINQGFFVNSAFGFSIDNFQTPGPAEPNESAVIGVVVGPDGSLFARWGIESDHFEPIPSEFGAITSVTLELLVNVENDVTARWDFGSDDTIDLVKEDFARLLFLAGTYTGSFELLVLCPGDIDDDRNVGITDFLALLAAWGPNPGHYADVDFDGTVGILDFLMLLANWGPCP